MQGECAAGERKGYITNGEAESEGGVLKVGVGAERCEGGGLKERKQNSC